MDDIEQAPEVAAEQTIESETSAPVPNNDIPVPVTMVEVRKRRARTLSMCSLKPGRTIIGPGSKVIDGSNLKLLFYFFKSII